MYKAGEEIINKGLSPFTRILLGFFSGAFGLVILFSVSTPDKAIWFYLLAGFCLSISFACIFTGKARQFFGSLVGSALFLVSVWYLLDQVGSGQLFSARSEQSVFNAMLFLLFFGVPGLSYVLKAKFGLARKESDGARTKA